MLLLASEWPRFGYLRVKWRNCVMQRLRLALDEPLNWPASNSSTRTAVARDYVSANGSASDQKSQSRCVLPCVETGQQQLDLPFCF